MLRLLVVSALVAALAGVALASDIHGAAREGDLGRVRSLVAEGATRASEVNEWGTTPLHFASVGGSAEVVRFLLEAGADVNARNDSRHTPLHFAASFDHPEIIRLLVDAGAELEGANLEGESPLHRAATTGARRAVELLLESGADVGARNDYGRTPLLLAARERGDIETARILIRAGADIDAVDGAGAGALDLAAWRGFRGFVDMLLDEGAGIPESESRRLKLLRYAAKKRLEPLANALLAAGLDINALAVSHPELVNDAAAGGSATIIELLADRGFALDYADEHGWTPLHCAAEFDRATALEHLLAEGVTLDARTLAGETAYNVAVSEGSGAAAELLAERGADTSPVRFPEIRGPYMDQEPPGDVPVPFAPGIVLARHQLHTSVAFSPDGNSACWSVSIPPRESGYGSFRMLATEVADGRWTHPRPPDYVGGDVPFFSPDGTRLYFMSREPLTDGGSGKENIWFVERTGGGWSEPAPADPVVNSATMHWQFSVDGDGTFYMGSGDGRILVARKVGGGYEPPVDFRELYENESVAGMSPFISPDGDYLIFSKDDDLSITFRRADGSWTESLNLGETINSDGHDICPHVTPDGKYLIYLTSRDGVTGPYWVAVGEMLRAWRREALREEQ